VVFVFYFSGLFSINSLVMVNSSISFRASLTEVAEKF
jgi:hypothetical protein